MNKCINCTVKQELDKQCTFMAMELAKERKRIATLEGAVFRLEEQMVETETEG